MHLLHVTGTVGPIWRAVMELALTYKLGMPYHFQTLVPRGRNVVVVVADDLHFIEHIHEKLQKSPIREENIRSMNRTGTV